MIKIGYIKNKSIRISYLFTVQYHSHIANNTHIIAEIKSGQHRTDDNLRPYKHKIK
jgi:hypothetical protein